MLRCGIGELRARSVDTIYLSVGTKNELDLSPYERTGFERVQEWPRWTRETLTFLRLARRQRPSG